MSIPKNHVQLLEQKTGHVFKNLQRLESALTHASLRNKSNENYERLEFLGDRVLGLVIAEMVCKMFKTASEGELAVRYNGLVSAETCAEISEEIGLPNMIKTGADVQAIRKSRLVNMYADVIEAVIAAIYLEGGLAAVLPFVHQYWSSRAQHLDANRRDAKTQLQEWAHHHKAGNPLYRCVSQVGLDHDPVFCIEVQVQGIEPSRGEGRSKRIAEQEAAKNLLIRENLWLSSKK